MKAAPTPPVITVAVCSYNRADQLATALRAINAQRTTVPYEVLVVDDSSTDNTSDVARSAGARVVRHERNRGIAVARQTALDNAHGDFIAFTDDDCVPTADWLGLLWQAQERHPQAGCWGGRTFPYPARTLVDRYALANNPFEPLALKYAVDDRPAYRLRLYILGLFELPDCAEGPVFSFPTGNLLTRRSTALDVGGFDPRFQNAGEDEDFARRVRESGQQLWYATDAVVHHAPVVHLRRMTQRSLLYGWGNAAAFFTGRSPTPTVYPIPLALALATLVTAVGGGRHRARLLATLALAPVAAYPKWARLASRKRSLEPLTYPYLQLLQESANDAGWLWYLRDRMGTKERDSVTES